MAFFKVGWFLVGWTGKEADFIILSLRGNGEPSASDLRSAVVEKVFVRLGL